MNAPPQQLESYLCGRWLGGEGVETERCSGEPAGNGRESALMATDPAGP